jgi:DNA-binding transcriptional regulator YiaG
VGKVEEALRDMVQYHGRRVAADALGDLPKQLREVRRQLRDVQRTVSDLASEVQKLAQVRRREMAVPPANEAEVKTVRFGARSLKAVRKRLDLTQHEMAQLLEVSPVTITSWETGKSRPRKANLAQIVTLKSMDQAAVDGALGREHVPASMGGTEVRRLRGKLGLTQAELAKLVGVSGAAVTSWETGKTQPGRENRSALLALLSARPDEIAARLGQRPGKELRRQAASLSPKRIREIRKKANLSQKQMATTLGVSLNTISNWETGRSTPRRRSLEKLLAM